MKQFFYTVLFVLSAIAVNAQEVKNEPVAADIKVVKTGDDLVISWTDHTKSADGSWEVQGSADGQSFSTIGLVWGPDPKAARNSYAFKQNVRKVQSKYGYFRVLQVSAGNQVNASRAVELSK
ncbi:MAG: hypothetical protein QM687_12600 [Ferruginibacter sp.]